ncbi:MAG: metalloregulator ArsR/SmtB family transcription factor [Candidatus Neomarinimicrobiota bacterium]
MNEMTKIFKALSDENRLRILLMLESKPLCVCEITETLKLATSTVSKHLSILRSAGFIVDEKDGKWVNYRLCDPCSQQISEIRMILKKWSLADETVRKDAEKLTTIDRNCICHAIRNLEQET